MTSPLASRCLRKLIASFDADFTLVKNWVPLLKAFKFTGNAPIQIKTEEQKGLQPTTIVERYTFKIRWFSPSFVIYTIVWICIRVIVSLDMYNKDYWWLQHVSANLPGKPTVSRTEQLIQPLRFYSIPIIIWFQWASILAGYFAFVQFLNNWRIFEDNIGSSSGGEISTNRWVYFKAGLLALMTAGILSLKISTFGNVVDVVTILIYLGQFVGILEDLKVMCMFSSVATGLEKVQFSFSPVIQETEFHIFNRHNAKFVLRNGRKLHKLLKEQIRLIESSQGLREIANLCYLVLVVTINVFLTLSPLFRGETPNKLGIIYNMSQLLVGLARLYMKCHFAEQITEQENLLVEALYSEKLSDLIEAKAFADSIVWNPTKVVYGSVITMDKRLILSIANQILTYIIILLQFQLSFGTNA